MKNNKAPVNQPKQRFVLILNTTILSEIKEQSIILSFEGNVRIRTIRTILKLIDSFSAN